MTKSLVKSSNFSTTWTPYPFTEEQFHVKGLKLHLGPSDTYLNDFINIDVNNPIADINGDAMDLSMFKDNTVSMILASHLIEHFSNVDAEKALKEWYRVLKPNCQLILELPDIYKCFKILVDKTDNDKFDEVHRMAMIGVFGRGDWSVWQIHRYGYCVKTMINLLKKIGFSEVIEREPLDSSAKMYSMRVDARKGTPNV